MKQKNKLRKHLSFVLAVTLLLCASFVLPVCAHDDHSHAVEGITFFFTDENGNVLYAMPRAACCSNPSITDYKEGHDPKDGYCYTYIVQVCGNCGNVTRSTATSIGGCTWWCELPNY